MKSLKEIFRIGKGPSSSHTMGPAHAAEIFARRNPNAKAFEVTLYGSLAATGKGHLTDVAITEVLSEIATVEIVWQAKTVLPYHTNGMRYKAFDAEKQVVDEWVVYSVGGGALSEGKGKDDMFYTTPVYQLSTMKEIQDWCEKNGRGFWEYVDHCEGAEIWEYLHEVWTTMCHAVEEGLENDGVLPGPLNLSRKAGKYYIKAQSYKTSLQSRGLVYAYALAVSEENAAGGTIVTAPTCGSCGVMPAVLYHLYKAHQFSERKILRALPPEVIFANLVK